MKQQAAATATSIRVITAIYLGGTVCLIVGTFFQNILLIPSLIMGMIAILCYVYCPRFYEISGKKLIIHCRLGEKEYEPVQNCRIISEERQFAIRLWGNGGLFSSTGIFWNKSNGIFYAYVTASKRDGLVMIETQEKRIMISPEYPQQFVRDWLEFQTAGDQGNDLQETSES